LPAISVIPKDGDMKLNGTNKIKYVYPFLEKYINLNQMIISDVLGMFFERMKEENDILKEILSKENLYKDLKVPSVTPFEDYLASKNRSVICNGNRIMYQKVLTLMRHIHMKACEDRDLQ
jgi:hypothetical protein